jgi:threonine/homoserine efflux transporter RhtA
VPGRRAFTAAQWRPVLGPLTYAVMNLSLYTAIARVGLGLAVTLEFLGPLSVALIGLLGLLHPAQPGHRPALARGQGPRRHRHRGREVLSSAVPLLCDMLALRRVPAQFFGVFMSVNPVFAALAGLVVLGQHLVVGGWLALAVIVAVNTVAVSTRRPRRTTSEAG